MPEFPIPGDTSIVVNGPPQLDPAALLVFLGGHCHSLAVAVHDQTASPLVAVDRKRDGKRVHVAVRDPDGNVVDIAGHHTEAELQAAVDGGVAVNEITTTDVDALHRDRGWAKALPDLARPWVPIALDPTTASQLGPMTTPNFTLTTEVEGVEIRILWDGKPELVVDVRLRWAGVGWRRYGRVLFPKDPDGQHRFEFTPQRFEGLVEAWLRGQFDVARAHTAATA